MEDKSSALPRSELAMAPASDPPEAIAVHLEDRGERPIDLDDPHRAALEDNPASAEKLTLATSLAILSLILFFVCPLACSFLLVSGILTQIGTDLGDVVNITWIVGGWSIASSISFSIAGSFSDIFGRRYAIILGDVLVLVGCVVCCTAQKTLTVAAGSTVIGWGMGIVFVAYAGIAELLPNKWRSVGLAFTEVVAVVPWGFAAVIIATLLSTNTSAEWRWCYYIGIIYGAISLIGVVLFYFPPSRPQYDYEKSRWEQVRDLDYIGILLYSGGLTILLIGLTWGGTTDHPWTSASTLAPIIVGFFTLCACFAYDFTLARQPLFPLDLFAKFREFTLLLVIVFVAGIIFYSMSALLPQGSLYMFTNDPIQIGITQLPSGAGLFFYGCICTLLISKTHHLRIQMVVYLIIQTVFVALYSVAVPNNRAAWMAFQFFGNGPFTTITILCYTMAGLNVPLRHLGLASGLIGTFRSFGGSVGNAIFSTILNNLVDDKLPGAIAKVGISNGLPEASLSLLAAATVNNAIGIPGAFATVPGITPTIEAAAALAFREVYAYAFRRIFWATIPFGIIAIAAAFFVFDPSVYLTNHTAVHMEDKALIKINFQHTEKSSHHDAEMSQRTGP